MDNQNAEQGSDLDFQIQFYEKLIRTKPDFVDALIPLADAYTKRFLYEKGLEIDKRLARLCPDDPSVFYNLACSYSLVSKTDQALEALRKALELGFSDRQHLIQDPDLNPIRKDPRFQVIVDIMKK